ncbi:hypothetical protein [Corynebacterium sp. CCM 9203]|uniref:hypothetical protein n=1 Tax=Corynebacterium sp. CCM 9203 TaxID=3057615 RepID=UPI0035243710
MFNKRLITATTTIALAAAGFAAPASAYQTEFNGFLLGDTKASAISCGDVESVLTDAGLLKKKMTEKGLRKAIDDDNTALIQQLYGSPDATEPVTTEQAKELAERAAKCDLVEKESDATIGDGFGSSEITKIIAALVKLLDALNPGKFHLDKIVGLTTGEKAVPAPAFPPALSS